MRTESYKLPNKIIIKIHNSCYKQFLSDSHHQSSQIKKNNNQTRKRLIKNRCGSVWKMSNKNNCGSVWKMSNKNKCGSGSKVTGRGSKVTGSRSGFTGSRSKVTGSGLKFTGSGSDQHKARGVSNFFRRWLEVTRRCTGCAGSGFKRGDHFKIGADHYKVVFFCVFLNICRWHLKWSGSGQEVHRNWFKNSQPF